MELREVIAGRKSIRRYKGDPVPLDVVEQLMKIARKAPSAGGLRAYKIIVTDQKLIEYEAPLYLVICALPDRSGRRYGYRGRNLYAIQDATIAGAYIQLLAVDVGLDTVWVGAIREGRVKQALNLPEDHRPIAVMPIGYRDVTP